MPKDVLGRFNESQRSAAVMPASSKEAMQPSLAKQKMPSRFWSGQDQIYESAASSAPSSKNSKQIRKNNNFSTTSGLLVYERPSEAGTIRESAIFNPINFSNFSKDDKVQKNRVKAGLTPSQSAMIEARRIKREHLKSAYVPPSQRNKAPNLTAVWDHQTPASQEAMNEATKILGTTGNNVQLQKKPRVQTANFYSQRQRQAANAAVA